MDFGVTRDGLIFFIVLGGFFLLIGYWNEQFIEYFVGVLLALSIFYLGYRQRKSRHAMAVHLLMNSRGIAFSVRKDRVSGSPVTVFSSLESLPASSKLPDKFYCEYVMLEELALIDGYVFVHETKEISGAIIEDKNLFRLTKFWRL